MLFQAVCASAHLERQGLAIIDWSPARVNDGGLVTGLEASPAPSDWLPQKQLIELLRLLFGTDAAPAGRGEGRRIARELIDRWRQSMVPISVANGVEELLAEAGFLWRREFAAMRVALGAQVSVNGGRELRVLGPLHFLREMLSGADELAELDRRLTSDEAGALWMSVGDLDPRAHVQAGRWRAAARAWRFVAPERPEDRVDFARCLYAVGRFEDATVALKSLRRADARVLRLWCLYRLGRLGPAVRELGSVQSDRLTPRQRIQVVAVALRVFENRGARDEADRWLAEGLEEADAASRRRAELLAATHAWDRGELDRMRSHLGRVEEWLEAGALDSEERSALLWRWHKASGLESEARGDGAGAVEHFAEALRAARRRLTPFEAGLLWNELALGRASEGDLRGAERALKHTRSLHREVQGSRSMTATLFNLAEIRIRLGRLLGVREILEEATVKDRRARNWRSVAHDLELWVRYELARGRPHAALLRARDAMEELGARGIRWRSAQLHQLAARALGWLGRPAAAREELESRAARIVSDLEAEEVPALWALAGDRESALAHVGEGPFARLWTLILTGNEPAAKDWLALETIEPYRAGRFVFDCELIVPGTAPPAVLRRAVVALREAGAGPLAERLDDRDSGTWRAVSGYLAARRSDPVELDRLFTGAGYPDARLLIRRGAGDQVVREARGGEHEVSLRIPAGELVLQAPFIDEVQRVLLTLIGDVSELRDGDADAGIVRRPDSGIIGESPALVEVLERASRLAPAEVPILIQGETGTGKELLAHEVHALGRRPDGPFVVVNCAGIAQGLLTSYLFGHVRGSFTGAIQDRAGVFETASRGMVFLDEIGDLPLEAQGYLLRVLQEGEVVRVGENLARKTDVRVVSATNRNLDSMVKNGTFRADLFFRLRVGALTLPPLRERGEDILLLAEHFLRVASPGSPLRLSSDARSRLAAYEWPGNVRELASVLTVAAAYADGEEVLPENLELPYPSAAPRIGYQEAMLRHETRLLREALAASGGNRAEAARRLGLSRQAVSQKVRKLGLDS